MRGLPESAASCRSSALREEIETPGEGQIRAMLTLSGNPVLSTPDGARLDESLAGLDFMAAVDIYLNETTRHADVILPPTTALERDHYDLVFHTLAVRNTARFTPAVLPAGPTTRATTGRSTASSPCARWRAWTGSPRAASGWRSAARMTVSPTRLVQLLLLQRSHRGRPCASLRASPEGIDLGPLRAGLLPERLQTRDQPHRPRPGARDRRPARGSAASRPPRRASCC